MVCQGTERRNMVKFAAHQVGSRDCDQKVARMLPR
jgi:hypothetical protein